MNSNQSSRFSDYHCTVLQQKHLVSEMTRCDKVSQNHKDQYECYLEATRENRENSSCMFD